MYTVLRVKACKTVAVVQPLLYTVQSHKLTFTVLLDLARQDCLPY